MILDVERLARSSRRDPRRASHLAELDAGLRQDRRARSPTSAGSCRTPRSSRREYGLPAVVGTGGRDHAHQDRPPPAGRRRRRHGHDPADAERRALRRRRRRRRPPRDDHRAATSRGPGCRCSSSSAPPTSAAARTTSEGPAPGFLMNHCTHWTRFYGAPRLPRLRPLRRGPALRLPRGERGDDLRRRLVVRRLLGLARRRRRDRAPGALGGERPAHAGEQIARFSQRDAETYLELLEAFERALEGGVPPAPLQRPAAVGHARRARGAARRARQPDRAGAPVHDAAPARPRLLREPTSCRSLFMRAATTSTGCFPDDVPGLQGLVHCLPLTLSFEPAAIAVGRQPGDQRRARLARGASSASSTSPRPRSTGSPSTDGRASGVELADGETRRRRHRGQRPRRAPDRAAPARTATCRPTACAGGSRTSTTTAASCCGPTSRCTSRPTTWPSGQPGVGAAAAAVLGPKDPDYIAPALPARDLPARLRRRARSCSARSTACGTRAARRPGKHLVGVEEFAAPRRLFSAGEWRGDQGAVRRAPAAASGSATRRT